MRARIQKAMDERDQGFTLIELLVVVIIIGILAAIAIPIFLNQRKKAVDASIKSDLHNAATLVETWATDNPSSNVDSETVVGAGGTGTAAAGVGILSTLKVSSGNTISMVKSTGTAGAYCLYGTNPNSDANSATAYYEYASQQGGLMNGVQTAAQSCA